MKQRMRTTHIELLRRERSSSDPSRISLHDPNHPLDHHRWYSQPCTNPTDTSRAGSHVWVGTEIEIEHESVCTFDEDSFVLGESFVEEGRTVDNVTFETFGEGLLRDLMSGNEIELRYESELHHQFSLDNPQTRTRSSPDTSRSPPQCHTQTFHTS